MMQLLYFEFVVAATIYVLTESILGGLIRRPLLLAVMKYNARSIAPLVTLVYCPMCAGFWIGFVAHRLGFAPWASVSPWPAFTAGCAGIVTGMALVSQINFYAYERESDELKELLGLKKEETSDATQEG